MVSNIIPWPRCHGNKGSNLQQRLSYEPLLEQVLAVFGSSTNEIHFFNILCPGQMTWIKMLSKQIIKKKTKKQFLLFTTLSWWHDKALLPFKCTPLNSPQHKNLDLINSFSCRPAALQKVQSHLFPLGGELLHAWGWPGITLRRLRWILTPSRSCEKPCSGKEQPYRPQRSLSLSLLPWINRTRPAIHVTFCQ